MKPILITDSETANTVGCPLPYDDGYLIVDPNNWEILLSRSYVIAEIYLDKELMNSAYYAKKIPIYEADLKSGKREMKRLLTVRKQLREDMEKYDCNIVCAYNLGFDKRAFNNDCRYITGSMVRWFFPYGTEFVDIWHMACSSFLRSKWYIKWALKNNYVTEKGNIKTDAETAYKYITKNHNFTEEHTGLEDCKIELEILKKVLNGKMKYETNINTSCWRIVQERKEEIIYDALIS